MARIVPDVSTEPLNARPTGVKVRANSNGECFAEEIMDSLQKAPVCSSTGRMENILDEPSGGKGMRASRAGSLGTVYPTVRITDKWGILEVYAGALMSPDWKQVTVAAPADPSAQPFASLRVDAPIGTELAFDLRSSARRFFPSERRSVRSRITDHIRWRFQPIIPFDLQPLTPGRQRNLCPKCSQRGTSHAVAASATCAR
jgi:hypothetical protein